MGKIIFGNKNFGYAPINISEGSYSFGAPVILKGLVSVSAEVEQENTKIYADDSVYCIIGGAKSRTITANLRYIPEAYAPFLGFVSNGNGSLTDTGDKAKHCIFFETEEKDCETGAQTRTLHYFYNVVAKEPTLETSTTEEEIESAELEIEYDATESSFVLDDNGKNVSYMKITRTAENATLYDQFTTQVIKPTDNL